MANLGQKLKEARNRKGISIREASESTKIRGDYLTRFEGDDFEVNLPPVYLRGFLTNYARYLDLDPEGILADFDALQPADKRRPRKAAATFGAISLESPAEEGSPNDPPAQTQGKLQPEPVFPWLKVGIALGSMLIVTILIVLLVQKCSSEDPLPSNSSSTTVVDPNVVGEPQGNGNEAQARVVKLIPTGPINLMFVKTEVEGQQVFRNLKEGDEPLVFKFKKSFTGGASSIENLKFEVDGKQFGFEGNGPLNFSWPQEPPKDL